MTATQLHMPGRWQEYAACQGADTFIFFPVSEVHDAGPAKRYCKGCPVIGACLDAAIHNRESDGIFGGMTTAERRAVARERGVLGPKNSKGAR